MKLKETLFIKEEFTKHETQKREHKQVWEELIRERSGGDGPRSFRVATRGDVAAACGS